MEIKKSLKTVLRRVNDERVLNSVVAPLAKALTDESLRTRRYAAVVLAALVPRIRDEATLRGAIPLLTDARAKDPDVTVREYTSRALSRIRKTFNQPKPRSKIHSF